MVLVCCVWCVCALSACVGRQCVFVYSIRADVGKSIEQYLLKEKQIPQNAIVKLDGTVDHATR
jgi:hypothetical protein